MLPVKSISTQLSLPVTCRLLSVRCTRYFSNKTEEPKHPLGTMETMLEQAKEQQNNDQAPLLKTKDFTGTQSYNDASTSAKPSSDDFISPHEYEEEVKEMKRKQDLFNHMEMGSDEGNRS
ncbi:hypothetical protein K7432_012352 [Basidiobolus ranarum]|uniref:Uncharacterized protein n=1 Tax=Basidiobolus ranarum TaxID=34480 RepID=A0ABR2WL03_9FUNG